jgi:hypothetical protein
MTEVIVTIWKECDNPECQFRTQIAGGTIEEYEVGKLSDQARSRDSGFQHIRGKEYCHACATNSRFVARLKAGD